MFHSTALLTLLFVLLWNSGFIGAEYCLSYAGPFTQLFWRYLALMLIVLVYLISQKRFRWPGWKIVAPTFLIGILAHAVWLSCSLLSIQYAVPAGIVALIVALQPLTTGALSGIVVGESTPKFRWVGLGIGFTGVALPVIARIELTEAAPLFAYFIPLGAVGAMTGATLIQRKLEVNNRPTRLPFDLALFYQSLASALMLIIPAVWVEGMATQWHSRFLGAMAWLIFAVSLCAYVLMFELIKKTDATRVSSLFYLGPPVTMLMAWALFSDTIRIMDVVGLAIVAISIIFVQLQIKEKKGEIMPELPDVEVFKQYLDATSLHRKIDGVSTDKVSDMLAGVSVSGLKKKLKNRHFSEIRRHGKYLFAAVTDNRWLLLHFGMTGFLKYFKKSDRKPSHVRLQIDFANNFSLAIDSQRRLGKIGLIDDPDAFIRKEKLGPDALNDLTFESFEKIINQGRGGLKSLLMNQKHLAGIGNIYSDEILFQARLHPCIKVKEIKDNSPTIHRLYNAVTSVLDTAITAKADPDDMPDDFLIPNRKKNGQCPQCEKTIKSEKCAGRTSYFCPECQKM